MKDARLSDLFTRRLLVVSGKGGVGKTSVAAVLAALAARSGRSVLLVSSDGRGDAARLFGAQDAGYVEAELAPGLRTLTAGFDDLLADFVHTVAPVRFVGDRILASSTFRYFTRATPGLPDLLLLGKARELFRRKRSTRAEPRYDLLVLDAPATGHARSLLALPRTLLKTTPAGPLRKVGSDVDRILADPAAAALVVVSEPAEFAAREAEELSESAKKDAGLETALVVVNRIGRSGRPETLPATALPVVRIPELETLGEDRSGEEDEGATAFFETFLSAFEENLSAPKGAVAAGTMTSRPERGADDLSAPVPTSRRLDLASWLAEAPLLALTGAGGVGKTTLAAGSALGSAREGTDTLVMTFDPSERLKDVLGVGDAARDREVEVDAGTPGTLHASLLDAQATFDRIVSRHAPDPASRERILRNRFYAHLSGGLGGILEYMAVERLYEVAANGRHRRVVLDTPPVRQALDFLDAPARIVGFLDSGAVEIARKRWFDDRGRLRATSRLGPIGRRLEALLDASVGLDLLRDVAEFFQAFGPLYDGFRKRAEEVQALLRDAATTFVLVTSPGAERLAETLFFARKLTERGHHLGAVVVNRVHPEPRSETRHASSATRELVAWLAARDRRGLDGLRDLMRGGPPVIPLPMRAEPPADLSALETLGGELLEAWRPL